ncbi:PREDICTED: uncharacterized protein LOC106813966 [Priapulus caudatus]|uniref:Uncharacterized protein LOC106813966 n=1 Tax=Priapulus caudatus TaxID=37621 RepID=A0ABM1ENE2_PRICU|nr:PREDICTED: uncharacterized protein LOC106813966 [Priapulus caudatus]
MGKQRNREQYGEENHYKRQHSQMEKEDEKGAARDGSYKQKIIHLASSRRFILSQVNTNAALAESQSSVDNWTEEADARHQQEEREHRQTANVARLTQDVCRLAQRVRVDCLERTWCVGDRGERLAPSAEEQSLYIARALSQSPDQIDDVVLQLKRRRAELVAQVERAKAQLIQYVVVMYGVVCSRSCHVCGCM